MPGGTPRTEAERALRHLELYGTGSVPPTVRMGLGPSMSTLSETLWAWAPDTPVVNGKFNPPFPRWLNARLFGAGRRL